jgi:hypothetical protein
MMNGTIINRTTNLVSSTLTPCENSNNKNKSQQQQQQQQSRKLSQISSFKFLFLVCIIVVVNFSILSTLLNKNDAAAQRILSSQNNNAYDSLISKKYENSDHSSTTSKSISISSSSRSSSSTEDKISIPYYLKGKTQYQQQTKFNHKTTFQLIHNEVAKPVNASQRVWVLSDSVKSPTRNHESVLLEYNDENERSKQILINVLGRYSRGVQWMDLQTGEQNILETNGTDPDHRPLNDLNHVASVVVDSIDDGSSSSRKKKEIWLPCGFHNDRIGKEVSSNCVR